MLKYNHTEILNMSKIPEVIKESHPDWKSFNKKAREAVFFSNYAYSEKDKEMQELADKMPKGYEMFLMTDHVDDSKEASFRCVAFMNQETKEIVFATAGTRIGSDVKKGLSDLYDDALMVAHNKPRKMNPAQVLNDMILDSLGDEAKNYKFHYTGHSLGAAMAEMQAADMDIKLTKKGLKSETIKNQISAVTFENPGTKPMIEKMYKEAGLPKENIEKLNFSEFNNRKNMINSLNEQTGKTYTIIPHSQKERNPTLTQMVFEYVAKIATEVSPLLGKAFGLLAPGGITDNLQSEHSLENFDEVFVQKEGKVKIKGGEIVSLEEAYSGVKPIEFDQKVTTTIREAKSKNGNIGKQNLSMNKMNFSTGLDRQVFSSEELKMATKKELKMEPKKTIIVEKNSRQSIIDRITSQKEITGEMKLQTTAQIVGRSAGR
jgi:hypothetical protein